MVDNKELKKRLSLLDNYLTRPLRKSLRKILLGQSLRPSDHLINTYNRMNLEMKHPRKLASGLKLFLVLPKIVLKEFPEEALSCLMVLVDWLNDGLIKLIQVKIDWDHPSIVVRYEVSHIKE